MRYRSRTDETIERVIAALHLNASDWISLVGTIIAVISLAVAIVQGKRAGDAKRAVERTRRQIAGELMRARTPQLEQVEHEIRDAANAPDRAAAESGILEWRRIAAEHTAFLSHADVADRELSDDLMMSLGLVDTVLGELAAPEVECEPACRRILVYASRVCQHSRRVAAAMMF